MRLAVRPFGGIQIGAVKLSLRAHEIKHTYIAFNAVITQSIYKFFELKIGPALPLALVIVRMARIRTEKFVELVFSIKAFVGIYDIDACDEQKYARRHKTGGIQKIANAAVVLLVVKAYKFDPNIVAESLRHIIKKSTFSAVHCTGIVHSHRRFLLISF